MELDLIILSRLQFAFTIAFHIIWPTLTIGLGIFLFIFEIAWLKTKQEVYKSLYQFWVKIFALAFGIGVVTGIALSYQFGTNFSVLSAKAGPILGALLSVEVMTAFFLEAAFIGVMLFGWNRVPKWIHMMATTLVMIGTHNSAFWVIAANSFMHTPQGYEVVNGTFVPVDWMAIIFNPSFPYRMIHMLLASYISAALVILAVSSVYLLKEKYRTFAKKGAKFALIAMLFLVPTQIFVGDLHGLNTLEHQPVKIAAMEGLWETQKGVPLVPFAIIDEENEQNLYAIEIPNLTSWILTHSKDGEVKGLKEWAKEERPPVAIVFYGFRIMVGLGMVFLAMAVVGNWLLYKKKHHQQKWFLRLSVLAGPLGFVATITGWIVAEVGRQPWVIYGALKTADSVSPVLPETVLISLIGFIIVYTIMFIAFCFYAYHLVKKGPNAYLTHQESEWLHLASHTSHLTDDDIQEGK